MKTYREIAIFGVFVILAMAAFPAVVAGQSGPPTPPDMTVCDNITCDNLPLSVCSAAGFKITLTGYDPAATSNGGTATYTYQICNPPAGTCVSTVRSGESCLDNSFCQKKGQETDPNAYCTRECATDTFRGLSHFDATFPALGGVDSCLGTGTQVTGTCTNGNFVLGDGSCFEPTDPVAKCDNTNLAAGNCLVMTVSIAGENTGLGMGAAVLVDKEATTCTASCVAGPSCDRCDEPPDGAACLTRTIGFWGTHPHIANLYDPVTVCGVVVNNQQAGTCSTSEALCSSANDNKKNPTYLSLVAQLTAAKLNLKATAALVSLAQCSTWSYLGHTIQEWIATCEEQYCSEKKQNISVSGCIAALTAFNESQDTGFDVTLPPFDRPGPANVEQCQLSRGNGRYIGLAGGLGCVPAP